MKKADALAEYKAKSNIDSFAFTPPSELKPFSGNPRKNEKAVAPLMKSFERFGIISPLIVRKEDNMIIAGHTRWKSAIKKDEKFVPVLFVNFTLLDAKAYNVADNKVGDNSEWNDVLLDNLLEELIAQGEDKENLGFIDEDEIGDGVDGGAEEPEVEFSEELLLEHNYVVLYFDNPFDWQVAVEKFGLKKVKDLIPRKGQPQGIGRVIKGSEILERL